MNFPFFLPSTKPIVPVYLRILSGEQGREASGLKERV